jgi:hypothetical protein
VNSIRRENSLSVDGSGRQLAESACRLCLSQTSLVESHIIPAFVARWIKATSATGFLRGFNAPNQRMQDFPTVRLLCQDCEQRFSVSEKKFAESIFVPFHEGRTRFAYEDWLMHFAASLAWRCLVTSKREGLRDHPQHEAPVELACDTWADFLLGRTDRVGPYRFNLFFTSGGGTSDARVPDGMNWYFLRGADMTPVYSKTLAAAYAKLPGMFFWTSIVPPDPGGWSGTRIAKHGTIRGKGQLMKEAAAGGFLMSRIDAIYNRIGELSPKQTRRIEDAALRDPERTANSRSFEAWLHDEHLRQANKFKT